MINQFKKGDALLRFGKVYQIFKIKDKKINGKKQTVICYKNFYFKKGGNISCSIPVANLDKIKIRKPFSRKELSIFLKLLEKEPDCEQEIDFKKIDKINSIPLDQKAMFLKRLWLEKQDSDINFSFSKKNIFSELLNSVKEELAYVYEIELTEAEKKIKRALEN